MTFALGSVFCHSDRLGDGRLARVPSLEAFGRRPPVLVASSNMGPSSETLHTGRRPPVLVASSNMGPSSETLHTSCHPKSVSITSAVPQIAADLLQRAMSAASGQ
jgi:hypothetical protein